MNIFQEAKQILDKDGKVNALGPYGKQKLTGREVSQYFKKNKVSDSKIKKAVEVALDLGGAMDIARKEIKKFYGDKILKSKEVQNALRFANEEVIGEGKGSDIFKKYGSIINRLSDKEKDEVIELLYTMNTQSGRRYKEAFGKVKELLNMEYIPEDSDMAINPKTINKTKPMLMKYAKKFGVDLEFGYKGRMPSLLQVKSKSSQAEKGFLDAVGKDKQLMKLLDHVEHDIQEGKNLVPDIKKIVDTKGAKKVGGVMIDMFTASMISQIYDKVNDQNKKKMEKSNIQTLVGLAQKMMQKNSVNEETLAEGYSKKMSDREIEAVAKKYNMGQDEKDDYKKQYSPAKIGKGSSWLAITYPVKDGEYYFAFISKDEKKNVKYNDLLNKELKKLYKKHLNSSGKRGSTNLADAIWDDLPEVMKGFPRDLGWNDTMTREEIWGAITNMSGLREDMEESNKVLIGKMRLGKRKKAPKFEGANPAQQAAIAISKKEKAGKPGYDKEGKSLKKESVMDTYRQMWEDGQKYAPNLVEVTDKEINAMKQLSKDAEKIKKNYQKIVNMGDKELKDRKYNKEYEDILKMQQSVLSLIGKLSNQKLINKESLEEKLSKADLKMIDMMYDKKGKLTDVGKAVMNYKPGDNIRKIVQNLNNKK